MSGDTRPDDDSYQVRVRAMVLTRDESSGGWLSQDGSLSRVGVAKLLPPGLMGRNTFIIHGERIKDQQVTLSCELKKDLLYIKATPTFHHWQVDEQKCGLTFQCPWDARAFERGVRRALEDLTEGSTTSSSTLQNETELGDDDVFTTATDSSSGSSQRPESRRHHPCVLGQFYEQHRPSDHRYFLEQAVHMFPRHVSFQVEDEAAAVTRLSQRERTWLTGYEDYRHAHATGARDKAPPPPPTDAYFTKSEAPKQRYGPIPLGRDGKPAPGGCRAAVTAQPLRPAGKRRKDGPGERLRCVYCQDLFERRENGRGRCQEAPDAVRTCIRRVSFMWCADTLLYHCMSDPEGEYSDPCSCDTGDERFCLRWAALLGLALLAPCMCCYAPLRACHRCGVACRCCGGKHKAAG